MVFGYGVILGFLWLIDDEVEHGEGSREIMQIFLARDVSGMRCFLVVWIWAHKKMFGPKINN
jgi:hypothetical protein